jgi:hypothetical protein
VLRHVVTLVARGVPASELFAAAAEAVSMLLGADRAGMIPYVTSAASSESDHCCSE